MDDPTALLVYDADCPYCSGIARLASHASGIRIERFGDEAVQELLDATFEDPGFTMYLFTDGDVYWGSAAAEESARLVGLPSPVRRLLFYCYPYLVKLFTVLSRRRRATAPSTGECDVCSIGGATNISGRKDIETSVDEYLDR